MICSTAKLVKRYGPEIYHKFYSNWIWTNSINFNIIIIIIIIIIIFIIIIIIIIFITKA